MNAIPVERAQDLAVTGKGTVTLELGKCMVTGVGTEFKKAFAQPKSSLAVKVPSGGGKHETCVALRRSLLPMEWRVLECANQYGSGLFAFRRPSNPSSIDLLKTERFQ